MTISIGVADAAPGDGAAEPLVAEAVTSCSYAAKQAGRNAVARAGDGRVLLAGAAPGAGRSPAGRGTRLAPGRGAGLGRIDCALRDPVVRVSALRGSSTRARPPGDRNGPATRRPSTTMMRAACGVPVKSSRRRCGCCPRRRPPAAPRSRPA
ncbi:hypothetical protein HBB16_14175 [Pseudonocardia sp. MCCB 268]|nr:hypothetical protein [Pseudonocardia cytotoxica]